MGRPLYGPLTRFQPLPSTRYCAVPERALNRVLGVLLAPAQDSTTSMRVCQPNLCVCEEGGQTLSVCA
nr:MAG TPA: hypothetical protein [Caudoviricetes sp.]